jgi:putative Holliday junction resolvase
MRVLGIDYGSKRVGIALGDTETRLATAWQVMPNDGLESLVSGIADLAEKEEAEQVVVGVPHPLQDAALENDQVREIRGFIAALKESGLDVVEWDEGLTSKIAAQQEQEGRPLTAAGRASSKGEKRDDLAAAAMLDGWLSRVGS